METYRSNSWPLRLTLVILAFLTVVQGKLYTQVNLIESGSTARLIVFHLSGQSNGPIRLRRYSSVSLSYTSGRVQVYVNSRWGNICDDASFGLTEATVICHQLGYTGASSYSRARSDM